MKRSSLGAAMLAILAATLTVPAHADTIIGPSITSLSTGTQYVNPRLSLSVPVSYSFSSPAWTTTTVDVKNSAGDVVRVLDERAATSGSVQTSWNGRDDAGAVVPDGVYSIVATPAGYDYASTIGSYGSGNGQLDLPVTVGVAKNGTLWVADGQNDRLEHFAADGSYLSQIPASGTLFDHPQTIHFDSDGSLLVSNASQHAFKIDPADGHVVAQIPPVAAGGGDTTPPYSGEIWDLQQLSNGNYLMSGSTGCCPNQPCCGYWSLWEYSSDFTTFIRSWGGQGRYQTLTQLPDSTIVGGSGYDGYWGYFAPAGYSYGQQSSICAPGCRTFGHVYGTTLGTGNSFIASAWEYHQIAEFPESSASPTWVLGTTAAGSAHGQFEFPRGLVSNGDDLYVADYFNNRVEHFVRAASTSISVIVDTTGPSTSSVTLAPSVGGGSIITATADDSATGKSPVVASEYFVDTTNGADGSGHPLTAQDGAFDSATETVFGYLNPATGQHTILLHSKDAAGNWGGFTTIHVLATPAGVLELPV